MQNEFSKFCKRCHVRCHINWVQDFHWMFYLNSHFLLIEYWLLNSQIYQAVESIIMNHRVHYFHDLSPPCFYCIKAMSLITGDHLLSTIFVKTKSRVYMHKKTSAKLSRLSDPSLNKSKCISYIFVTYPFSFTS